MYRMPMCCTRLYLGWRCQLRWRGECKGSNYRRSWRRRYIGEQCRFNAKGISARRPTTRYTACSGRQCVSTFLGMHGDLQSICCAFLPSDDCSVSISCDWRTAKLQLVINSPCFHPFLRYPGQMRLGRWPEFSSKTWSPVNMATLWPSHRWSHSGRVAEPFCIRRPSVRLRVSWMHCTARYGSRSGAFRRSPFFRIWPIRGRSSWTMCWRKSGKLNCTFIFPLKWWPFDAHWKSDSFAVAHFLAGKRNFLRFCWVFRFSPCTYGLKADNNGTSRPEFAWRRWQGDGSRYSRWLAVYIRTVVLYNCWPIPSVSIL